MMTTSLLVAVFALRVPLSHLLSNVVLFVLVIACDPGVLQELVWRHPLRWIRNQKLVNHVLRLVGHVLPGRCVKVVVDLFNLLE